MSTELFEAVLAADHPEQTDNIPSYGGTVLEFLGVEEPTAESPWPQPPQTPPQPFQTNTTSGEGWARIQDDQDHEWLYE